MMKEIQASELSFNPFTKIGEEWMLVTAGDEQGCNTMTASWGGLGVMWGKPVAYVFIRPQRYTKEFIDRSDRFTLSFYDESKRGVLKICGAKSGRDFNKVKELSLNPVYVDGTTTFAEADLTFVCKKLYAQELSADCALGEDVTKHYPANDYHTMYVAEIIKAYRG